MRVHDGRLPRGLVASLPFGIRLHPRGTELRQPVLKAILQGVRLYCMIILWNYTYVWLHDITRCR